MCHLVPHSLIILVHVGIIVVNTMALASGIIASSCLTHKRVHGNIVIQNTLILECYKAIVVILICGFSPGPIRWYIMWYIR